MFLKRKRSSSEFSSSTLTSSPPRHNSFVTGDAFSVMRAAMSPSPSHLNSRTMKRFRNGRPTDDEVHQRTLNILFSAQRQQTRSPQPDLLVPSVEDHSSEPQQDSSGAGNQQSLHRFWNINSAPRPLPSFSGTADSTLAVAQPASSNCEDCGAGLANDGDDYSDSMDVDHTENTVCSTCGKHVCFSCSVSNLGDDTRCLRCAGQKSF